MPTQAAKRGILEDNNPPGVDSCLCGMLCIVILVIGLGITLKLTIHHPHRNTRFIGP